jgi:hypothetical protein
MKMYLNEVLTFILRMNVGTVVGGKLREEKDEWTKQYSDS